MTIQKLLFINFISKKKAVIYILFAVALVVVFSWFRTGSFIGGNEEGMWLYNPKKSLDLYSTVWTDLGVGVASPTSLPRVPVLLLATLLSNFLPIWCVQAVIYFIIIFSGIVGMYLLSLELLDNKKNLIALSIALFYFFNIFSMTQVWKRDIYSGMFSWSYIPILLYLFIKWIKEIRLRYLLLIIASSFIYSVSFVTVSFVFTVWIPVGLFVLCYLISNRKKVRSLLKVVFLSLLTVLFWGLASIWWIYPGLTVNIGNIRQFLDMKNENLISLVGVSKYFPSSEIMTLRQTYYMTTSRLIDGYWETFYNHPLVYLLNYSIVLIVLLGILTTIKKKYKYSLFLLFSIFIGWFVSKGSNPPFGYSFYNFLFTYIPFTVMFRNPYEKLGLLFLLPYSILYGIGVDTILNKLKNTKLRLYLYFFIFIVFCGFLVWPMWTGNVYARRMKIKVPDYYSEVKNIIDSETGDSRILFLPLIEDGSATYKWGYSGMVPINELFDNNVIVIPTTFKYPYFKDLQNAIAGGKMEDAHKLFNQLNVNNIVLANDIADGGSNFKDAGDLNKLLKTDSGLVFLGSYGELSLYKYMSDEVGSNILALGKNAPKISYKKNNPTDYYINIKGAEQPYSLIFKSTYDDRWKAVINGREISEHNLIYDYANSWNIYDKGNYVVHIYYKVWPWQ